MSTDLAERILDTALQLADAGSWESLRLHDVAREAGLSLEDVRGCFREKDELIDAWFDRADRAMLTSTAQPEFVDLPVPQRLHRAMMAWYQALAAHRRVTRQMVCGRLEPGHLHIQVPALMRVSRTVQWIREAAHQDAAYLLRPVEETALTSIYLLCFVYWMNDDSGNARDTARVLEQLLDVPCRITTFLGRFGAKTGSHDRSQKTGPEPATGPPV